MKTTHRFRLKATALLPVALGTALALTGCGSEQSADATSIERPAPEVFATTLSNTAITPYFDFIGRTASLNDVTIMPQVSGNLTAVKVKDGDFVNAGEVLFEIDPRPFQAEVAAAEAHLAQAESKLSMAKLNMKRAKDLLQDDGISQMTYDTAQTDLLAAEAGVKMAEAKLEKAELMLSYTQVSAPFAGRVGMSDYDLGDLVRANADQLTTLVSINPVQFNFTIDEKLFRRIRTGLEKAAAENRTVETDISLKLSDGTVFDNNGKIDSIGNRIDPKTGSIELRASFDNDNYMLMPGEYATLQLEFANQTVEGLLVEQATLQQNQTGFYAMVIDENNVVNTRVVKLGQSYGSKVHVLEGLKAGERIVTAGLQKIRPGMTVKPTQNASQG